MDSFQISGRWDEKAKCWLVDIDPTLNNSAFVTGEMLSEVLFKATGMLLETRKFRREKAGEKLAGEDGFEL